MAPSSDDAPEPTPRRIPERLVPRWLAALVLALILAAAALSSWLFVHADLEKAAPEPARDEAPAAR